jgi:hypothetical protein
VQGIRRAINQADKAGENIAAGQIEPDNMIDLLQAAILVKANAATLKTADEMLGAILDTRA